MELANRSKSGQSGDGVWKEIKHLALEAHFFICYSLDSFGGLEAGVSLGTLVGI